MTLHPLNATVDEAVKVARDLTRYLRSREIPLDEQFAVATQIRGALDDALRQVEGEAATRLPPAVVAAKLGVSTSRVKGIGVEHRHRQIAALSAPHVEALIDLGYTRGEVEGMIRAGRDLQAAHLLIDRYGIDRYRAWTTIMPDPRSIADIEFVSRHADLDLDQLVQRAADLGLQGDHIARLVRQPGVNVGEADEAWWEPAQVTWLLDRLAQVESVEARRAICDLSHRLDPHRILAGITANRISERQTVTLRNSINGMPDEHPVPVNRLYAWLDGDAPRPKLPTASTVLRPAAVSTEHN